MAHGLSYKIAVFFKLSTNSLDLRLHIFIYFGVSNVRNLAARLFEYISNINLKILWSL